MLVNPTAETTVREQRISQNPHVNEAAGAFFPPNPYAGHGMPIAASYDFEHALIPKISKVMASVTA